MKKSAKESAQAKKGGGEPAPAKHRGLKEPWKPGQSGNPAGRPKGSRNQFAEAFITDLYHSWLDGGADAVRRTRQERPADYLRVCASLLPKQLRVEHDLQNLTDAQILERLSAIDRAIAEQLGTAEGVLGLRDSIRTDGRPH